MTRYTPLHRGCVGRPLDRAFASDELNRLFADAPDYGPELRGEVPNLYECLCSEAGAAGSPYARRTNDAIDELRSKVCRKHERGVVVTYAASALVTAVWLLTVGYCVAIWLKVVP